MRGSRIQCFIAIKLGRDDTDAVYAKMATTADELGLNPRRIDRIEHIENINQKILSELNDADIVLADLTYARPSVYYEAGYAQRKTPVIYTCRKDHLHSREDSRRVHFDVDRYPIIFWDDPGDKSFIPNLKARLQKVIADLLNLPLINELNSLLTHLKKSSFNPETLFKRMESLFSRLEIYPRVPREDLHHEGNIEQRLLLYTDMFTMIETELVGEATPVQQDQWTRFSGTLEKEILYLEELLAHSNYGERVMYTSNLSQNKRN